jgi:hypothetical protein
VDVYQQFANGDNSLIIDTEVNVAEFEYYLKQEFDIRPPSKEEYPEKYVI